MAFITKMNAYGDMVIVDVNKFSTEGVYTLSHWSVFIKIQINYCSSSSWCLNNY
jgi:hypothetical protein